MSAGRSDGNTQDRSRLFQREILIKNQVKNLALTVRQLGQSFLDGILLVIDLNSLNRIEPLCFRLPFKAAETEHSQETLPSPFESGYVYDRKYPGPKARFPIETSFAFQNFQVDALQNISGLVMIEATAAQRPSITRRVQTFELCLQIGRIIDFSVRVSLGHSAAHFCSLVVFLMIVYDSHQQKKSVCYSHKSVFLVGRIKNVVTMEKAPPAVLPELLMKIRSRLRVNKNPALQ